MKPPIDSSVKSVKRCLDLLELLARAPEPLSFLELMAMLEIPKSSLFHLMRLLITRQYLEQAGAEKRYRIGPRIRQLQLATDAQQWLESVVRPLIRQLADDVDELAVFYIRDGDTARSVVVEEGTHALSYRLPPDHSAPLHAFSAGKVVLAGLSEHEFDDYLANSIRTQYTEHTLCSPAALRRAIKEIRLTQLGRSRGEIAVGVSGFAVPVRKAGLLIGVINVSVPDPRVTDAHVEHIVRSVKATATIMEERLKDMEAEGLAPQLPTLNE